MRECIVEEGDATSGIEVEFLVSCLLHQRLSSHPHILKLESVYVGDGQALRVFCNAQSDLSTFMRSRPLCRDEVLILLKSIASAMCHLESGGVRHGRLCSQNVMMGASVTDVFVTGFGLLVDSGGTEVAETDYKDFGLLIESVSSVCIGEDDGGLRLLAANCVSGKVQSFERIYNSLLQLHSRMAGGKGDVCKIVSMADISVSGRFAETSLCEMSSCMFGGRSCVVVELAGSVGEPVRGYWKKYTPLLRHFPHRQLLEPLCIEQPGEGLDVRVVYPAVESLGSWLERYCDDRRLHRCLLYEVSCAVEHLNSHGLYVTDVEPNNCCFDLEGVLRLYGVVVSKQASDVRDQLQVLAVFWRQVGELCPRVAGDKKIEDAIGVIERKTVDCVSSMVQHLEKALVDIGSGSVVKWEDLRFVKTLGQGQFGEVKLMSYCRGNGDREEVVAVKTLVQSVGDAEERTDAESEFYKEIEMMKRVRHTNLIGYRFSVPKTDAQPVGVGIEYLSGGSLLDWLRSRAWSDIEVESLLYVLHCIALGLSELHRLQIVHRDLAARNVLVSEDCRHVKVSVCLR